MNRSYPTWLLGTSLRFGLLCAVAGAAAAFLTSAQLPKVYEARASLIAPTMAETYAEVAVSSAVMSEVVSRLQLSITAEALAGSVDARASRTSALLTIDVSDPDPHQAARIANAIADQLVRMAPTITGSSPDAQASIQADLATLQGLITQTEEEEAALSTETDLTPAQREQLEALQSQLTVLLSVRSSLLASAVTYSETVLTVLAPAQPSAEPTAPQPIFASAAAGLLGFATGVGVTVLVAFVRTHREPVQPGTTDPPNQT